MAEPKPESINIRQKQFEDYCDFMMSFTDGMEQSSEDPAEWKILRETKKEIKDFVPAEYDFQLNNSTVSLAGYWHNMAYYDVHKENIRKHIGGATVLVTELAQLAEGASDNSEFTFNDDFFTKLEQDAWNAKISKQE
jgi:hypothetical protein